MDKPKTLSELRPQSENPNLHTERGLDLLESSIQRDGWIGAMTVAANNETFDGSARLEKAVEVFGPDAEPIVIESDGTRPIVVKRIDIPSSEDPRFNRLSIAANRIAALDLEWDTELLAQLATADVEADDKVLAGLFTEGELLVELDGLSESSGVRTRNVKMVTCPECGVEFALEGR